MSTVAHLNVLVTATTGQALAQLARVDAAAKKTATSTNAASGAAGRFGVTGKQVAAGGLAALAYGAFKATKASIEFEDSFSNVRKTVEGSDAELNKIASGIRQMALEIPIGVNELANLAAQAGALGVPTRDLLEFTKIAAQLGVTTDMSSEQAANALARINNVMGGGVGDFSRMASALVDLGNKGASTEAEITDMALRFVGIAKQVGLSTEEVLGFSAALANVGEEAEAGGSAMSRAFIEMGNAVGQGGDKLAAFAQVSGVSSRAFAREFEQAPARAMVRFVTGLSQIRKEGGNVFQVLDRLGLSEIRVRRALLALAGKPEALAAALGISAEAWQENIANQEEFDKKAETTESGIQLLKNAVNDLAISLGDDLRPAFDVAVEGMTEFFEGVGRGQKIDIEKQFGFGALSDSVGEWGDAISRHFDGVKGSFNSLKGAASSAAGSIGQSIKNRLGDLGKGAKITIGIGGDAVGQAKRIWSSVKGVASRAINFALGIGGDIIGKARRIWGQVKGAISRAIRFVLDLPGVGGLVSAARSIWNAIDSALPDITVNIDIPTPSVPDIPGLASGSGNFRGGLAMVNERGAEMARMPGGGLQLLAGGKRNAMVNLPRGAEVFTAAETRSLLRAGIPGYAKGKKKPRAKAQGNRWEAALAAAERTAGTADDISAINNLIGYWKHQAKKFSKPVKMAGKRGKAMDWGQLTNAHQQVKSYREMLADLGASAVSGAAAGDSAEADTLRALLAQSNLRYAVSQAQGGVLRSTPYVGSFDGGGVVPGPIGAPGLAIVHGGETISEGSPVVHISIANGMEWLRPFIHAEARKARVTGVGRTPGNPGALR